MVLQKNKSAKPEHATAKIAVWWDIKDCPIPVGYDAGRVRPSIEAAFKSLGYSGPVSITAFGDQKQTSNDLLRSLSSSGVTFAHSSPENTCLDMYSDLLEWRARNPPPATMMLVSDHVEDVLTWDLARLQQHTKYNLFRAYSVSSCVVSVLVASAEWVWESLLLSSSDGDEHEKNRITESSAMFRCNSCSLDCQSLRSFRKHLSSRKHVLEEVGNPGDGELDPETRMWGKNYQASPEHAAAQIAVWWDMNDCPVPDGFDARCVRPSLEGAFESLGYSGPVSGTAFGDLNQTSDDLVRALSSTGVSVAHSILEKTGSQMFSSMAIWRLYNPPPATMMIISNEVEEVFSHPLVQLQQDKKYNLFLAYSLRPYKMSILVTSAEWLWESFLAASETRRRVLHKCSEKGESTTGIFHCESCSCDFKGLGDFRKHLSSQEHAVEEDSIHWSGRERERNREHSLKERLFPESKRLRKASSRTGFRPFHNHLRLANLGARHRDW